MSTQHTFVVEVARALVAEVAQNTEDVLEAARQLTEKSWRGTFAAIGIVGRLESDLTLAMKLCDTAANADPNVALEDGTTPVVVKAMALFQRGLIAMGQKRFKDAVKCFELLLSYSPDQATYFNTALCFLRMKGIFTDRTPDAIAAFQKCIEIDPKMETAIDAGKELARLGRL